MAVDLEKVVGVYLKDMKNQAVVAVLRQGVFSMGRAIDNDLAISDPTVSSYHAKIYTYLTASYIEDLDSTNGTFIDGKRIKKHVLKPGAVIKLGGYQLQLEERRAEEAIS
ncbi:MAG: FHA domain-containing protein [Gammaproteobacteria bacterium]|nr:FHA domain-containing protein [Gammaproteobacteria bacterium]